MKPIFPILAFILLSITVSAQYQYTSIPTDKATWNYVKDFQYSKTHFHLIVKGDDTTINGMKYTKLYYRYTIGAAVLPDPTIPPVPKVADAPDMYYGAMREDNKRVYIKKKANYDTLERLIYDFNLVVGDTLPDNVYERSTTYPDTRFADHYVIDHIDTVTLGGKTRKRFVAYGYDSGSPDHNDSNIVTEGIGSDHGLFHYHQIYKTSNEFRCHAAPGILYGVHTPCIYTYEYGTPTAVSNTKKSQPIKVYPNPTNNSVHIEANDIATITLYNTMGQVVYQATQRPAINIEHLPAGTYILMLRDKDKNTKHKQLLIKQ